MSAVHEGYELSALLAHPNSADTAQGAHVDLSGENMDMKNSAFEACMSYIVKTAHNLLG